MSSTHQSFTAPRPQSMANILQLLCPDTVHTSKLQTTAFPSAEQSGCALGCLTCCRLKADDPFQVNQVFTAVWNCMGLYPLIYAAILIPGARTDKVQASTCGSAFAFFVLAKHGWVVTDLPACSSRRCCRVDICILPSMKPYRHVLKLS